MVTPVQVDPSSSIYAEAGATGTGSFGPQNFNFGGNPNLQSAVQAATSVLTSSPWTVPALVVAAALLAYLVLKR